MIRKTYILYLFFSFCGLAVNAQATEDLQKQLDTAQNECVKVDLYTGIANNLIQFNEQQTRIVTNADAAKAVDYVLKAVHINAKNNDTLALRSNFDCLAQAYFLQKKYTQAKWFILQSNCISRDAHDVPHIIYSLIQMAQVKTAIKDYKLAQQDLNEAIVLAKYEYNVSEQIKVEKCLAALYDKQGNVKAAIAMVKHYTLLADNLKKEQQQRMLAMQKNKPKAPSRSIAENTKLNTQYPSSAATRLNIENGIWAVRN